MEFTNRLNSFSWALGGMLAAVGLDWIVANLGMLDLPQWAVVLVGLGIAQLTKYLRKKGLLPLVK